MSVYHQRTLQFLTLQPAFSASAQIAIEEREQGLGIVLPPSVWEWYALDQAVGLESYRHRDEPVPLQRLGEEERDELLSSKRKKHLRIMRENGGVCSWAVTLDKLDDPPVMIDTDRSGWHPHADTFSQFVFARAWDWSIGRDRRLHAPDVALHEEEIARLQNDFHEGPRTYGWPGLITYRFWSADGTMRLLIWNGTEGSDWFLAAETEDALVALVHLVRGIGTLSTTLRGDNPSGEEVLKRFS